MIKLTNILLVATMLLATLSGCSTTRLQGRWLNPAYEGKQIRQVLVLGVSRHETYLRIFEDSLSSELDNYGVRAEPAYILFPKESRPDRETIARLVTDHGYDAMIISTVTGRRLEKTAVPADPYYPHENPYLPPTFYRRSYDYYSRSYDFIHEPAYIETYEVITVQNNLYDTKTDELIWSATTETEVRGETAEKWITSLVDTVIEGLREEGLL